MGAIEVAVIGAAVYFAVFGTGFVFRPALVGRFGLRWDSAAGRTEVRCYYGAVSWALSAFLVHLLVADLAVEALTGVLFLASAVLLVRVVGTLVDGGRDHPYTRAALPVELAFVVVVGAIRILG